MTEQVDMALVPAKDSIFFDVAKFEHAQRVAKVFAASTMVPDHFRENVGNCLIAMNLAERMGTDLFMLMQNLYIVHGKPGIEAKLAIAAANQCGKFSPLQFRFEGEKDTDEWQCICHAKRKDTGEELESIPVSIGMAKAEGWYNKQGSKWKTMPALMMQYRSAMFFCRVYCPEVLLGMYSREELYDAEMDLVKRANGTYGPEELADKLDQAGEPGTAEELYKTPPTDNQEADVATLFEELTKIPLSTFENYRTKGVTQFARDYRDQISTWPEEIRKIVYAKFDNPNHPEWAKLLQPETKALPKDDEGEDWNGLKECPKIRGNNTPKINCKPCKDRPGCPAWGGGVKAD